MLPSKVSLHIQLINAFFFFPATATTEIYTLSLHDALPIFITIDDLGEVSRRAALMNEVAGRDREALDLLNATKDDLRSEEHTSELQSRRDLVCRLLLEKKKHNIIKDIYE